MIHQSLVVYLIDRLACPNGGYIVDVLLVCPTDKWEVSKRRREGTGALGRSKRDTHPVSQTPKEESSKTPQVFSSSLLNITSSSLINIKCYING